MASAAEPPTALEQFRAVVQGDNVRLDRASLLLAAHIRPGAVDVEHQLRELDALAQAVSEPTLDGVARLLFRDLGFTGNSESYFDPANSYLDQVVARRVGIPITLSVLFIEIGRRVGVPLFGVGMPGHFLVGDRVDADVFVDAFAGTVLDTAGAQALFEAMQPQATFEPGFLAETSPAVIVLRMLNNLRMIHHRQRSTTELVAVLEMLTCLDDCPLEEYRHLASALELLGRVDEAARRLEEAADRYGGTDADQLLALATRLWARLN